MDDLVQRESLYYQKFTSTPFNGEIDQGLQRGSIKNGKKEGSWEYYYDNGQLHDKGDCKNGKREGFWEGYWKNGQFHYRGEVKDGLRNGSWVSFWEDGTVDNLNTGTWEKGYMVSD